MLDANIIRGQLTTNILLTLGEHDIIEPHWSQEVLDEARRNRPKRMPEEEFDHRLQAMNGFFPEAMVSGYEDLKPTCRHTRMIGMSSRRPCTAAATPS